MFIVSLALNKSIIFLKKKISFTNKKIAYKQRFFFKKNYWLDRVRPWRGGLWEDLYPSSSCVVLHHYKKTSNQRRNSRRKIIYRQTCGVNDKTLMGENFKQYVVNSVVDLTYIFCFKSFMYSIVDLITFLFLLFFYFFGSVVEFRFFIKNQHPS